VKEPNRRIFVYRPSEAEPEDESGTDRFATVQDGTDLGLWLFSPLGAIAIWLVTILVTLPAAGIALLLLPEQYGLLLAGFGTWLVLGLIVIHWWVPPAHPELKHSEGIAIAGWHVLTTAVSTGVVAWLMLFPDGRRPVFTIADLYPVLVISVILIVMFATVFTLLRGHFPGRGVRYSWTVLCLLGTWMTLWLVAAHGGLH
jgi:hypothetical protein